MQKGKNLTKPLVVLSTIMLVMVAAPSIIALNENNNTAPGL